MNWTQEERSLYSSNTGRMDLGTGPSWGGTTSGRYDSTSASTTYSNGHSGTSSSTAPSWSHEGEEERLESLRLHKGSSVSTVGRGTSPSSDANASTRGPLPSWSHEAEEERLESLRQAKARSERNGTGAGGPPPSWSHEAEEERLEAVRRNKTRNDYSSTATWGHEESLYDSDSGYVGRPINTNPPGQEECPFCMRHFSLSTIEKHVEQCMRLQDSPSSSSSTSYSSQRSYSSSNLNNNSSYYGGNGSWEEEYGVSSRSMRDDSQQLEEDERLARKLYEEENRRMAAPTHSSRHSAMTTYSSSTPAQIYAPPVPVYYPRYHAPVVVDRYVRYPRSYAPVPKIKYEENKRFILKQKGWMFGGDMYIKDTEEEELFRVKGRLLSLGTHLTICDLKRNPLVDIKQSFFIPKMPQFHVYQGENLGLHVKKKNKGRNDPDTFSIDSVIDGTRLKIVGEWYTYEYEIHRGTGSHAYPIATVARRQWNLLDSYSVEVAAGEDALLILALCIIIDKIGHE